MTAYAINGNNYVKLRDVGEAVNFNVYWDGKAIQIESDKPYTGEAPASQPSQPSKDSQGVGDGYLVNGKSVTEGNVLELLRQIEKDWPNSTVWGTHNTPGAYKNEVPSTAANRVMSSYCISGVYACGGYVSIGNVTQRQNYMSKITEMTTSQMFFQAGQDDAKLLLKLYQDFIQAKKTA